MILEDISKAVKNAISGSTKENTQNCKQRPLRCLRQIVLDGVMVCILYSILAHMVDGVVPNFDKIFLFLALWTAIMFLLKSLDVEQSDQFSRVAFWTIATKVFGILTVAN